MADHATQGAVEMGGIVDVADHQQSYEGFLKLVKWVSLFLIVLLILLFAFVF